MVKSLPRSNVLSASLHGPLPVSLVRNWRCSTCTKSFSRKGDLTRHQQLHTGVKKHVCPYQECGKTFSQFSGLKTHVNVHTRVKPYICKQDGCMASFGDPSSCARHRKETHRVKHPYKCPAEGCISRIKRRSAFAAHLKKHGIDPNTLDLEALVKPLKTLIACRKSISAVPALAPAHDHEKYLDPCLLQNQYMKISGTAEQQRDVAQAREHFHNANQETGSMWFPNPYHQRGVETYLSAPNMSTTTLSTSAQSSTETLVDCKYDEYTNAKMFYADVNAHPNSLLNGTVQDFRPSSSSSCRSSPVSKEEYLSPLSKTPQELQMINAQEAFDRQRYHPNVGGNNIFSQIDHRTYGVPQEKGFNYPLLNPSQSQWQSNWGFA